MGLKFSNFGKAKIGSAPVGTAGLSFSVEAGKGLLFPPLGVGDYFYGIFKDASGNREIVKVEARTWAAGDYFVAGLTNVALQESLSNANLIALGELVSAADTLPYFTGAGTADVTALSAFIRTLLDDADAAAARATLGVATSAEIIPTGTPMLFYKAVAPTGWTQVTTHNNKALRIVSGTGAGSGGSVAFTSAFANQAVTGSNSATTLTEAQIPAHTHSANARDGSTDGILFAHSGASGAAFTSTTNFTGSSGSHNHTFTGTAINLAVQYVDIIIASRN